LYAVIDIAGKQFKVQKGESLRVPLVDVEEGSVVECDNVLFYSDGESVKVGNPSLDDVKVTAEVVEHGKDDKIVVFRMKRRKKHRVKRGHRQQYTLLKIKDIKA